MERNADPSKPENATRTRRVAIWDTPTRIFHWTLAILFIIQWFTGWAGRLDLHIYVGEFILALVIFRFAWGFVGSRHSRFRDFLAGPRAVGSHLGELIAVLRYGGAGARGHSRRGHTVLGGWMIVAMLMLLLAQAGSGLFASDEIVTDGPLNHLVSSATAHRLTAFHAIGSKVLLALVGLHIAAALFYLFRKRENLIWPLITGRRDLPDSAGAGEGRFASRWLALGLFLVAILIVRAIISL